jgi:hypothetical protein
MNLELQREKNELEIARERLTAGAEKSIQALNDAAAFIKGYLEGTG